MPAVTSLSERGQTNTNEIVYGLGQGAGHLTVISAQTSTDRRDLNIIYDL